MRRISIFTKFTGLILLAALLIAVSTHAALFFNFRNLREKTLGGRGFQEIRDQMLTHVDPNDTVQTRAFLERYGLGLRYVRGAHEWASSPEVPTLAEIGGEKRHAFWKGNRRIVVTKKADATFIIQGVNLFEHMEFPWGLFLLWMCMLVVIFGLTHFSIGKLLRPVRTLQHGVRQVSEGKFDVRLSRTTSDELGQLIDSFNKMALQIENDIKSRDQLLRDISHEFRSPLARMLLALEFVPEGAIRQTFKRNITVLEKLTGGILEGERLDSPYGRIGRAPVQLAAIVREIVEGKRQGQVALEFTDDGTGPVEADEERIRMAISNVIDNAVNYSGPQTGPVLVRCVTENGLAVVQVKDGGIGIPVSEIPFIFEPFYRVDKARRHRTGGYGLGLHLTKKIVEAHGGTVSVESVQGAGTTVTIRLPLREDRGTFPDAPQDGYNLLRR